MDSYFIGTANASQNPSTGATNYIAVDGKLGAWATAENQVSQVIPHALTISNLRVDVATAPGAAKSYVYTVQKNGSDTGLTVTITGASTLTQTDSTHTASFSAGDTICLKAVPSGFPTAPSGLSVTLQQTSASGQAILFGLGGTQITASAFVSPTSSSSNSTPSAVMAVFPEDGTVSNLWVKTDVDPAGTATWTCALRRNGAVISPAISAVLTHGQAADGNGHITSSDTTNTRAYTAGERIDVQFTAANTPAASRITGGFTWNPTTAGKAVAFWSCTTTATTNATRYAVPHGADSVYQTTEAVGATQAVLQACTLETLYLSAPAGSVSPGTFAVTVRANSTTNTALTATLSAQAANITGQAVTVTAGDKIDYMIVPASSPAARTITFGIGYSLPSGNTTETPLAAGATSASSPSVPTVTAPGYGIGIVT